MQTRLLGQSVKTFGVIVFSVIALLIGVVSGASQSAQPTHAAIRLVDESAIALPVLHYQGRLLDPLTGNPKPNGSYPAVFRLYATPTGNAPLWSETKNVTVTNGLMSTLLGDVSPFALSQFNGQSLWLGVTMGGDPESTPRQRIAAVAYAFYANEAGNASTATTALSAASASTATAAFNANALGGLDAAAYVQDSALMTKISQRDGAGSGLDADTLDGQTASAFASSSHNHDGVYFRRRRGTQYTGSLNSGQSVTFFTYGWASDEVVIWSVLPTTNNGTVTWSVRTELEPGVGIKYYVTINNAGSATTSFAAHYAVLP